MNITECEEITKIKKHDLIPTVIDHIFTICKEDKNFTIKKGSDRLDKKLSYIDKKLFKQESLVKQSNKIKTELIQKIKHIDDESFKIKYKVLETLGSEL